LARTLSSHGDARIRERAKVALAGARPPERQSLVELYQAALKRKGARARGRELFTQHCAACHRVGESGSQVGPDISDTFSKTAEQLLVDILDPSRAVDANYTNYVVRTRSGAIATGFIAAQTAASLTLRRGEGQEDIILQSDILEMSSSGLSLMPEGLESSIDIQGMADLIAWLKNWREPDRREDG
jgi:putative heme-binding domain-containing protein